MEIHLKIKNAIVFSAWQRLWLLILAVCGLIVIFATYQDYGATWDEPPQAAYGELVVDHFRSGFKTECNTLDDTKYKGPIVEAFSALLYETSGLKKYETRHLVSALLGLAAILAATALGGLSQGRLVFFFTPLILALMPQFYGHAFINSKDIPFACGYTLSVLLFVLLFSPRVFSGKKAVFTGLAVGFALAVRMGGVLLALVFVALGAWYLVFHKPWQGRDTRALVKQTLHTGALLLLMALLAWMVLVAFWPWAQQNPLVNPAKSLSMIAQFHRSYPVLYRGQYLMSDALPWHYLPWYLCITTPLATLALFFAGLVSGAIQTAKNPGSRDAMVYVALVFWFFPPIVYFIIKRPNVYDGIRHFMFLLPALAIFAARGAGAVVRLFHGSWKKLSAAFIALFVCMPLVDMAFLHPYESVYYNALAGGVRGAAGKYETDYWLSGYKEAILWINAQESQTKRPVNVLVAVDKLSAPIASYYAAPGVRVLTTPKPPAERVLWPNLDYYVSGTRYGCHTVFPDSRVVHTVGRAGVAFIVVKGRKG